MSHSLLKSKKTGFTLIELLVVISIISLLSSIVLFSLNNARAKARDAKRVEDLHQLSLAIEMYYLDNGFYPLCENNSIICGTVGDFWGDLETLNIVPHYMKVTPTDPINTDKYGYYYIRGAKPNGIYYRFVCEDVDCNDYSDQHYIVATQLERSSKTSLWLPFNALANYLKGQ